MLFRMPAKWNAVLQFLAQKPTLAHHQIHIADFNEGGLHSRFCIQQLDAHDNINGSKPLALLCTYHNLNIRQCPP